MTMLTSNFDGSILALSENLAVDCCIGKSKKFSASSTVDFDVKAAAWK